jgi:MFS family permease
MDCPGVRLAIFISFFLCLVANTILLLFSRETLKKRIIKPIEFNVSKSINFLIKLPKQIKSIFLFASLLNFASSVTLAYWIFYALDIISISPFEWGLLGSLMFAVTSLFIFAGGKLSDKYGRRTVMLVSAFGSFVVPILFILSKNFFHLIFVYILMGFAAIGYSSIMPYIADHTNYKKRAKVIGLTTL